MSHALSPEPLFVCLFVFSLVVMLSVASGDVLVVEVA